MLHGTAFIEGGFRPVVIQRGTKWTHVVYQVGSHVKTTRTKELVKFRPLPGYENRAKLAKRMLKPRNVLGVRKDITAGARRILERAAGGES